MNRGYVKLHRALSSWEWYTEPNMVLFFVHCLIRANHKDGTWKGQEVLKGQFISGRKILSVETGLSERNIRTCIDKLKKSGELTIKTTNKNTLFTLNNWNKYQIDEAADQPNANKRPASDQQTTTNKNVNNDNNVKKSKTKPKKELFLDCLMFTAEEREKLKTKYPSTEMLNAGLNKLNNYIMSSGKKYKSHYHTMIGWVFDDVQKGFKQPVQPLSNQTHTFDHDKQSKMDTEALNRLKG